MRALAALASVVLLTVGTVSTPADATVSDSGRFVDDDESIFEADIEWLASTGVTLGCNPPANDRYCPNEPVTRGQMAAFLTRLAGLTGFEMTSPFVDDDASVFENEIAVLAYLGVTAGCNPPANDEFCPSDLVTRGQMAAFLVRMFGLPPGPSHTFCDAYFDDFGCPLPHGEIDNFREPVTIFASDAESLYGAGITTGCSENYFCFTENVSRGQMAAFLYRAATRPLPAAAVALPPPPPPAEGEGPPSGPLPEPPEGLAATAADYSSTSPLSRSSTLYITDVGMTWCGGLPTQPEIQPRATFRLPIISSPVATEVVVQTWVGTVSHTSSFAWTRGYNFYASIPAYVSVGDPANTVDKGYLALDPNTGAVPPFDPYVNEYHMSWFLNKTPLYVVGLYRVWTRDGSGQWTNFGFFYPANLDTPINAVWDYWNYCW